VCSADRLASAAGIGLLRAGGSAADAAIGAGAVLAVTAPHLCGLGGDLFAMVHRAPTGIATGGRPSVLNASGRAGSGADPAELRREGHTAMPWRGDIRSVTVPGCVDGWLALHARFGALALADVLAPAISCAIDGFPASPLLVGALPDLAGTEGADALFGGAPPGRAGEAVRRRGVARCLEAIAAGGRDGFYAGPAGTGLIELGGGLFTDDDLERAQATWVDPVTVRAWGHDIWSAPANSQGYLTLLGAAIAAGLDLPEDWGDPAWAHLLVESARLAGHDRPATLYDGADVAPLLGAGEVAARRRAIDPDRRAALAWHPHAGGTTVVVAVDRAGTGVSLIQSNAAGFGAHLMVPGVGIGLHNRGIGFSLVPGHPAELAPGRRPPHTLAPAIVTRTDGSLRAVLGTMGGDSQPQVLVQVLCRLLRHGASAAGAIAAPRWVIRAASGRGFETWDDAAAAVVAVEDSAWARWADGLAARGHEVAPGARPGAFGHAQLVVVDDDGTMTGAADPRAVVGAALGY